MSKVRLANAIYYFISISYHFLFLFTGVGNYFHGGTPLEWIALQAMGALIVLSALDLAHKAQPLQKIFILACSFVPAISLVWALFEFL